MLDHIIIICREKKIYIAKFMSAILNRHFDQFNDIFTMASIFFRIQHTQIRLKIYAGPNNNYLPLEVIFAEYRTRLKWSLIEAETFI